MPLILPEAIIHNSFQLAIIGICDTYWYLFNHFEAFGTHFFQHLKNNYCRIKASLPDYLMVIPKLFPSYSHIIKNIL